MYDTNIHLIKIKVVLFILLKYLKCRIIIIVIILLFSFNANAYYDVKISDVYPSTLIQSSSSKQVLSYLYPTGLTLPTNSITAMDLASGDLLLEASSDILDVIVLLKSIVPNSVYTSSEVSSMSSYYNLMRVKSIAMGLPEYYVIKQQEISSNIDRDTAIQLVYNYEDKYGTILFIESNWTRDISSNGYDIDNMLYSKEKAGNCYPVSNTLQSIYSKTYNDRLNYFKGILNPYGDFYGYPDVSPFPSLVLEDDESVLYESINRLINADLTKCNLKVIKSNVKPFDLDKPPKYKNNSFNNNTVTPNNPTTSTSETISKNPKDIISKVNRFSLRDTYTMICVSIIIVFGIIMFIIDYIRRKSDLYYQITKHLK